MWHLKATILPGFKWSKHICRSNFSDPKKLGIPLMSASLILSRLLFIHWPQLHFSPCMKSNIFANYNTKIWLFELSGWYLAHIVREKAKQNTRIMNIIKNIHTAWIFSNIIYQQTQHKSLYNHKDILLNFYLWWNTSFPTFPVFYCVYCQLFKSSLTIYWLDVSLFSFCFSLLVSFFFSLSFLI